MHGQGAVNTVSGAEIFLRVKNNGWRRKKEPSAWAGAHKLPGTIASLVMCSTVPCLLGPFLKLVALGHGCDPILSFLILLDLVWTLGNFPRSMQACVCAGSSPAPK